MGRERGGWFHYVNDPIGTPERLVDERGEVAAEYRRRAWGEMEALPGARATTPVRLQGQHADDDIGLTYNRWRWADPATGRFISSDPLGLLAGPNAYSLLPNPLGWIDPLGLAKKKDTGPYRRPKGFRDGVRDEVWDNAVEPATGRVRDPVTGQFMSKDKPWDMGHKPGYEFAKHKASATARDCAQTAAGQPGVSRAQFLDEHNDPTHYRPELPSSNQGHAGEAPPGVYYGP